MAERAAAGGGAPPGLSGGVELRRATREDIPRLRDVLAEAFHEDPILSWLIESERKRPARLRRLFEVELGRLGMPRGQVWTTTDLSGAAVIMPPGRWRVPPRVALLEGRALGVRMGRGARLAFAVERRHLRELRAPHYYVRDIGVLPARQGRGLGAALMAPAIERCDREGLSAYLEASSERSAALYERLGFKRRGELRVAGSPPLWPMLRTPAGGAPPHG